MDLDPLPQPEDVNIGAGQVPSGLGESSQAWTPYSQSTLVDDMDAGSDSYSGHDDLDDSVI